MMTYHGAQLDDPAVLEWIADHQEAQGQLAVSWFKRVRHLGDDVLELMHDGYATACIGKYPFVYVGVFKKHANVGFYYGAELADPANLLVGSGKSMRHVKLHPGSALNEDALQKLITAAYEDVKLRIASHA
ncbi:MAG: DUF1801 domain-containing protein [Pseudomonadota bacterium]